MEASDRLSPPEELVVSVPLRVIVAAFAVLCARTGAHAAPTAEHASTWSGYLVRGATFTSVSAHWVQPAISCSTPTSRASFWIGFDGFGTPTVEQVGTIGECHGGNTVVTYRAWWEMVASTGDRGSQPFAVKPGDHIDASVRYSGGAYDLDVRDETNGGHFSVSETCTVTCERSMAEWIVEAPGSGTYALANYKRARFTSAKAAAGGASKGIGSFPEVDAITMIRAGTTLSTPGRLSHHGETFSCTWDAAG